METKCFYRVASGNFCKDGMPQRGHLFCATKEEAEAFKAEHDKELLRDWNYRQYGIPRDTHFAAITEVPFGNWGEWLVLSNEEH